MTDPDDRTTNQKLVHAYNIMMERVESTIAKADREGMPVLEKAIDKAGETAHELGELTKEEAEKISEYLKRDLQDAAGYVSESGEQLKEWLSFDLELVENRLMELFSTMVDRTRLELDKLAQRADQIGEWHTGEVVGVGTLRCKACGELLHFHATGHIPPCPECQKTVFNRVSHSD
ncbi:MAG: zinc ribbon-containing protein [Gammaproteobacteria bacterium]|nr:zinc ribbon-containing protein [Gammaproteobacteria bacterium]MDH5593870.1 zinc ribbon-containing protein [Gammaproteobacteria bacterium]MDH5614200.1 zinc ribbon-containing protein [Gammaproteobacteria bacterium]